MSKKRVTFKLPASEPDFFDLLYQFASDLFSFIVKMARLWSVFALGAALLVLRYSPQYSVKGSYFWTCSSFLFVAVCAQLLYGIFLYPELLSPIKHIPTPKVSHRLCRLQLFRSLIRP
jgi:cytochrome bd-type quinol oxidase subunit 2